MCLPFRPELFAQWLAWLPSGAGQGAISDDEAPTFLARLQNMPALVTEWGTGGASYKFWPAQITAITNLEKSLKANKPRALIQMATGMVASFEQFITDHKDEITALQILYNRPQRLQGTASEPLTFDLGRCAAGPAAPVDRKPALAGLRRVG